MPPMKYGIALTLLGLMSLPGCASGGPARTDTYCLLAQPIYFDREDKLTVRTEKAIIAHNELWASACPH